MYGAPYTGDLEGCCSAFELYGFDSVQYYEHDEEYNENHIKPKLIMNKTGSRDELIQLIIQRVQYNCDQAICIAFTNQAQRATNSVLKELGFKCTRSYKSDNHPKSRVRLWWVGVQSFLKDMRERGYI